MDVPRQRPHVENLCISSELEAAVLDLGDVHPLRVADAERGRQRLLEELAVAQLSEHCELEVEPVVQETGIETALEFLCDLWLEARIAELRDHETRDFL